MKRTRRKNIFRGIKGSLNRFLSILFIVALGSGFMAGLAATSPDMYDTGDRYMDESDYYDIDVKCAAGLTKADVDAIAALEVIEQVQAATVFDMVLTSNKGENYTTRLYGTLDENGESLLNRVTLKEGRMPSNETECVVQPSMGRYFDGDLELGDTFSLSEEDSNYQMLSHLTNDKTLTIVGFVESPMCIGIAAEPSTAGSGRINLEIYTQTDFLALPFYTDVYVTVKGAKELNTFHEAYHDLVQEASESLTELTKLQDKTLIVRTRADSTGFSGYDANVSKVNALSKIFPVFFFLVALLVALTTMTRLVEENRTQIGTLKALGFRNSQVLLEYIIYSLASSIPGCILGLLIGFRLFPSAISSAYGMMYMLPETFTPFRWNIVLWVTPITIGSILLATLFACFEEFRACPATLIRPKAPAAGKRILLERIPFFWKRLCFTHKVSCRNLFRYKKRLFMTIIGVAGCSALLLTGFGLRDSINDIVGKQFNEVYHFELTLLLDDTKDNEKLESLLNDTAKIDQWIRYTEPHGKVDNGENSESIKLCIPSDVELFQGFVSLRERVSGARIAYPTDGVVLTEKLCETLKLHVGDTITLENADGLTNETIIRGITENYITSYCYLTKETYETLFGTAPDFPMVLCRLNENADDDAVIADFIDCDNVVYASSSESLKESFHDSIKSIDGVILVLILAAGLLCMVVLYNLTNVNICERRKELATIRVLGFHKREVERYIFRETNILSLLGSLTGLLVGIWLHSFVVRTVEIDQVMFGRSIYPWSYVIALVISMVFTALVNCIMRLQLKKIDMVEAMKENE